MKTEQSISTRISILLCAAFLAVPGESIAASKNQMTLPDLTIGRWPGRASDAYFEGVFQISVDIDPKMGKLGG